jgi:hypothetical protein
MTSIVKAVVKTVTAKSTKKPEAKKPAAPKVEVPKEPAAAVVPPVALVAGTVPQVLPDLTKTKAATEAKPAVEVKKAAAFVKKPLPFKADAVFTWVGPCPSKEGTKRAARYSLMQTMSGGTLGKLAEAVPARYVERARSKSKVLNCKWPAGREVGGLFVDYSAGVVCEAVNSRSRRAQ